MKLLSQERSKSLDGCCVLHTLRQVLHKERKSLLVELSAVGMEMDGQLFTRIGKGARRDIVN